MRAHREKLYQMGIRSRISRSTLADANEVCDWRIDSDSADRLIGMARKLYTEDSLCVDMKDDWIHDSCKSVTVLRSTTVTLKEGC